MHYPVPVTPFLTPDLPGIAGRIRVTPDDFEVDEVPAYEPCGSGDHLYLHVEKRSMGAEYFVKQIARRLGIATGDVGTAGLKDRHAVTRQMVSVPASAEPNVSVIDGDGIRVLSVNRHTNKLRPGHLRGNRFRILVRHTIDNPAPLVAPIVERIRTLGLPNFYGPQRFGHDGETVALGMGLVHGNGAKVRNPFLKKLALSAVQSLIFNVYLASRLTDNLLRTVLAGDVMAKWPMGGMFTVDDVAREQGRFDVREIVSAGPIVGRKTFPAHAAAREREQAALAQVGVSAESLGGFGKLLEGTRRHNLIYVDDLTHDAEPEGVRLTFTLPAGSYATVLLREVMKAEVVDDEPAASET